MNKLWEHTVSPFQSEFLRLATFLQLLSSHHIPVKASGHDQQGKGRSRRLKHQKYRGRFLPYPHLKWQALLSPGARSDIMACRCCLQRPGHKWTLGHCCYSHIPNCFHILLLREQQEQLQDIEDVFFLMGTQAVMFRGCTIWWRGSGGMVKKTGHSLILSPSNPLSPNLTDNSGVPGLHAWRPLMFSVSLLSNSRPEPTLFSFQK